ncbi:PhnA-like protein [Mesorhizobium yinganensis]|uniref:PhnA-like protein n=1 Tax=Mesorhizobium yinganensis TaxID=3157707 RepID=UPI003CCD8EAE
MTDTSHTAHTGRLPELDAMEPSMRRASWGAIFAGVVVALVVHVLLTMLGAGIGIATIDVRANDTPQASTFSIAAGIWYMISGIIAAFLGGYMASRLAGRISPTTGALHGLTTWALTTLLVLYFLTSTVGALVGGAFSGIASVVAGAGQTIAQTAAPIIANSNPFEMMESRLRASGRDPEALNAAAVNAMRNLVMGDASGADEARSQAAQALAAARGIPLDQATTQVAEMEKQYRDQVEAAKQQAAAAADATATVVSTSAISAFIALLLGAVASWFGGRAGVMHPVYADRVIPARRPYGDET